MLVPVVNFTLAFIPAVLHLALLCTTAVYDMINIQANFCLRFQKLEASCVEEEKLCTKGHKNTKICSVNTGESSTTTNLANIF
ncbi:hypothetical protein XELAEV_18006470mg [Xenopus laevis]|uniref:Uncharacterized protein n=1 Tax=Xenopus laevis TaxID=8355 RepID=A0A974DYM4_XENLA|nr:hypothetical protein XELAEV_18006470mg [Xenopus laevis]